MTFLEIAWHNFDSFSSIEVDRRLTQLRYSQSIFLIRHDISILPRDISIKLNGVPTVHNFSH